MTNEIPILPPSEVPSLEKRIFLAIIKDIENTNAPFEQKLVSFDIMIEGFKTALNFLYEFEKEISIEKISDQHKKNKVESYLHGLDDTILNFHKMLDYAEYEKTRDSKLLDSMVEGAKFTLNIFADVDEEWGNPWDWNSEYIKDTKSYFMGIRDALNKFRETIDYIIDYLHSYALFCPECGRIYIKDYLELYEYGINMISNSYPMKIERMINVINDIDLIKKGEYINKEYLWKEIKAYIDNMEL